MAKVLKFIAFSFSPEAQNNFPAAPDTIPHALAIAFGGYVVSIFRAHGKGDFSRFGVGKPLAYAAAGNFRLAGFTP
jgi:cbb3-type cytochrome oxidase subunit 3